MNSIHDSAAAAKLNLDNHLSLTLHVMAAKFNFAYHSHLDFIHGCHISTRVRFTFEFHPRLQIPISPSSNQSQGTRIDHARKINHGYQYLVKSCHDTRTLTERSSVSNFLIFCPAIKPSRSFFFPFLSKPSHMSTHLLIPVFK